MTSVRSNVVAELAEYVCAHQLGHPVRVAVDGPTAAGKSTFAEELAGAVRAAGRECIHLSTDDYHHLAERRHSDPDRARGYYRDAYDLIAFRRLVLAPLGPDGVHRYRARLHDLATDEILDEPDEVAAADAVIVVDGSFMQSAELADDWDVVVYLDVPFAIATERAVPRDTAAFGSADAVRAACADRYHAAALLYQADRHPVERADVVIDNSVLSEPRILRLGLPLPD